MAYRTLGGFGADNWVLCVLIIYTTLSLQILSNLANNLGDGIRGTVFWLGAVSILGALSYTMGKKPYGYHALGELAVLIFFFGYVAVLGGYYLQTGRADIAQNLIIATGVGLLSACVLYINNLRDTDTDRTNGKTTLAIVLERYRIVGYLVPLCGPMMCYGYHAVVFGDKMWALVLCLPLLAKHSHAHHTPSQSRSFG